MNLRFLDPEITRKLLEGREDVLTPAIEQADKFYAAQSCPRCGGSCRKTGDHRYMFKHKETLPRYYLECLACQCEFDPHSGLIIQLGNLAQAVEPVIPLINGED